MPDSAVSFAAARRAVQTLAASQIREVANAGLGEADILPFNFTNLTANITKYVREVTRLADSMRIETIEINRQLGEKLQEKIPEPGQTYKAPPMLGPVPAMDFTSLDESARKLADAARQYHASLASIFAGGTLPKGAAATNLGQLLARAEQTLTTTNGLPRRPWYRHQLYAPGYYTGYGVKTLPAVREAIEERKWDEAKAQIPALAAVLDRLAAQITAATALFTP